MWSAIIASSRIRGKWSPVDLFTGGVNGGYYNPNVISSLFQDTAGTIPVTADGQKVALIKDLSGNNLDLSQSIIANQPTFRTNGTVNWLECIQTLMLSSLQTFSSDCFIYLKHEYNQDPGISRALFGIANNLTIANPLRMINIDQVNAIQRNACRIRNTSVTTTITSATESNLTSPPNTIIKTFAQVKDDRSIEYFKNNNLLLSIPASGVLGSLFNVNIGIGNSSFPNTFVWKFFGGVICNKISTIDERNKLHTFFN